MDVRGTTLNTVAQPQFVVYIGNTNVTTVVAFMLLLYIYASYISNFNLYQLFISVLQLLIFHLEVYLLTFIAPLSCCPGHQSMVASNEIIIKMFN